MYETIEDKNNIGERSKNYDDLMNSLTEQFEQLTIVTKDESESYVDKLPLIPQEIMQRSGWESFFRGFYSPNDYVSDDQQIANSSYIDTDF